MQAERLEALPVLVKKAGVYRTRGGDKTTIYSIDNSTLFRAKGTIFPLKSRPRSNAWHPSGRVLAVGTHDDDLVEFLGEKFCN
jgi:hypothetical protein